ncbi:MAG: glycerol kinase GlpK [Oscillospiraceae bacterium]|nr:glycerol kinase GlpK [Oscillospiraceae bacterium]
MGKFDKYILALDQGTTSSRCIIFNKNREIVSSAQKELRQIYPREGWVEHDPEEILSSQISTINEALQKLNADYSSIAALGITNQRETTIVWDKNTGQPVYNAIVWQCRRTAGFCDELKDGGWQDKIKNKCGLVIDPYFSAAKIKWILDNVPDARKRAAGGELLFGTVDTWLIWNLSGGKLHITDYSNASRTMLYNIFTLDWDDELLEHFDIPRIMLPEVKPSSGIYGESSVLGGSAVISGIAGDQQAALFGQGCFDAGAVKNTYGTGCFMLMNTGEKPVISQKGLLTTLACGIDGKIEYALEGSVFTAGAAVQWLRDELRLIENAAESEYWANSVDNTGGVYIVPAFAGLGAPYWDAYARGLITGLTRGTNKAHIIRAVLEAMAYQTFDVLESMRSDSGIPLKILKVDGGACANNFLMQFQADIIQKPVRRPNNIETTALGAACLAGLAAGYWEKSELEPAQKNSADSRIFEPQIGAAARDALLDGWHKAVRRTL